MNRRIYNLLSIFVITLFAVIFIWWLLYNPVKKFTENKPGMDNRPANYNEMAQTKIGEFYQFFSSDYDSSLKGEWPRFRGVNFDNISKEKVNLNWGETGPKILWSVDLGEGHAGPAIKNGQVYLLDYDEELRADMLRCFSFNSGAELWRRWYSNPMKRNHGLSRTIPAVTDEYIVTVGPQCHVMCVKADSGQFMWGIDLVKEYGAQVPLWYTGQCPLISDSLAIIAAGGTSLVLAVHLKTGQIVWQTPNPNNWQMSHSSIIPATFNNKKMFVYCAIGGIVGISAEGDDAGQILWESPDWNTNVIAPSPIILEDGRIFVTAGYGAGSMMFKLSGQDSTFHLETLLKLTPKDGLASEQQTPIYYNGLLYCVLPKDAGPERNRFVSSSPDDLTRFTWSSDKTNRFGLGPFILVDDKFFILSDEGELTVLQADSKDHKQLALAKILEGPDAWGPIAVADGRMLLRDSKRLVCIEL